jgi:hypothetical protein
MDEVRVWVTEEEFEHKTRWGMHKRKARMKVGATG